jgi:hypothetical protein
MERLDRSDRAPPARGRDRGGGGDVRESRFHTSVAPDFGRRLRLLVEQQGAVLTADELSYVEEWFPQCRGKEHWELREYVAPTGLGAREYRVVRGSRVQDAYRSAEWVRAAAVRTALNELEWPERPRDVPGATA